MNDNTKMAGVCMRINLFNLTGLFRFACFTKNYDGFTQLVVVILG